MLAAASLDHQTFASLLRRPGYAKHYVVRDPRSEEVLGFCVTYLSYADQEGENLIASLAVLLVRHQSRNQGVGLSLHNHAIDQLRRTRGVIRVQLGSTFSLYPVRAARRYADGRGVIPAARWAAG